MMEIACCSGSVKNDGSGAKLSYNNTQKQDHRFTKRRLRQSQWFQSFHTAKCTIAAYEAMHMIRKGQVKNMKA